MTNSPSEKRFEYVRVRLGSAIHGSAHFRKGCSALLA